MPLVTSTTTRHSPHNTTWHRPGALQVNKYPVQRSFTAIGKGEPDFRDAMVGAVEQVVGVVHTECVSQRSSSKGQYLSVTVGPVWVKNSEEVGRQQRAVL